MTETMKLVGVKADGTEVVLGDVPLSPTMKARDIVRSYFGHIDEDEGNDAAMALWACKDLVQWMQEQGWTPPPMKLEARNK